MGPRVRGDDTDVLCNPSSIRRSRAMDCFACARNDTVKGNLAPLAGRGRRRREAKSPGEGDYPRVLASRESPSPARKMLATSPRKRGEVKNGRRAKQWIASWSPSSGAHSRDPLARNDGQNQFDRGCLKSE